MPFPLQSTTAATLKLAFDLAADLVISAAYNRISGPSYDALTKPPPVITSVSALIVRYSSGDIDGASIQPGDEKGLIRVAELSADLVTGPEDYLVELFSGLQRSVVAARLDSTRQIWILQLRRHTPEDRGSIVGDVTSQEDYGTLNSPPTTEDWQIIN